MYNTQQDSALCREAVPVRETIQADIILGNPRQKCAGAGICKINVLPRAQTDDCGCPQLRAAISVLEDGRLQFRFEKPAKPRAQVRAAFAGPVFRVFCPVSLPVEITDLLGREIAFLRPGAYPVRETDGHYTVLMDIKG